MFKLSCISIVYFVLSVLFVTVQCDSNVKNNSDISIKYSHCKYYEDGKSVKIIDRKASSSFKKLTVECSNQTIDNTFFDDFPNVWFANLSDNRMNLSFLSQERIIPNLETLILDRNFRCESNNCDPYRRLLLTASFPNLTRLYIRGNRIGMVSSDYSQLNKLMPHLAYLDMSDNGIHSIRQLLAFMPSTLTHLILDKNQLLSFDGTPLNNLEELSLNENGLYHLCHNEQGLGCVVLKGASSLKKLSIIGKGSYLTIDEFSLAGLTNLTDLNLSGNRITTIEQNTFNSLIKLKTLELQSCELRSLPNFSALESLVSLDVSGNNLPILSSKCIVPSKYLKVLNITNNSFQCNNTSLDKYCQDSKGVCVLSGCPTGSTKNCRGAEKLTSSPSRS